MKMCLFRRNYELISDVCFSLISGALSEELLEISYNELEIYQD